MAISSIFRSLVYCIWFVLPILACDMPVAYHEVTSPFTFTTVKAEDQEWDISVKPNNLYEVSIRRANEKEHSNYRGSLSIITKTLECSICQQAVTGGLEEGFIVYIIPQTPKIKITLLGMGDTIEAILTVREVPQSEATGIPTKMATGDNP